MEKAELLARLRDGRVFSIPLPVELTHVFCSCKTLEDIMEAFPHTLHLTAIQPDGKCAGTTYFMDRDND